jgi:hypothetical protein
MTSHVFSYFPYRYRTRRKVVERRKGKEVMWKEPNTEENVRSEVPRERLLQIKFPGMLTPYQLESSDWRFRP